MPSPFVAKLAKETGKSVTEVEKLWDKAKDITGEKFNKKEDDFGKDEFAYTVGVVKNMCGANENIENPEFFLNSTKSAREFLEEVMCSGSVGGSEAADNTVISTEIDLPDDHPIINKHEEPAPEKLPNDLDITTDSTKDNDAKDKKILKDILGERDGWV